MVRSVYSCELNVLSLHFSIVCGTHALAETAREAIRTPRARDILRGGPTVTLHVESFGGSVS